VVVTGKNVSRKHALIWREAGTIYVSDLASSNGTYLDELRIAKDPIELHPGSMVRFGDRRYRFLES